MHCDDNCRVKNEKKGKIRGKGPILDNLRVKIGEKRGKYAENGCQAKINFFGQFSDRD
jgi:hypothetical protein